MNDRDRTLLTANLTAAADLWTVEDLRFIIDLLKTILAVRTGEASTRRAYDEHVDRTTRHPRSGFTTSK